MSCEPVLRYAMRAFLAGCILLGAATATAAEPGDWTPSAAMVAEVESAVTLPKAARPLHAYDRYYTGILSRPDRMPEPVAPGRRIVWAVYELPDRPGQKPAIHTVRSDAMPYYLDGGCALINVFYDVDARRVVDVACNGLA